MRRGAVPRRLGFWGSGIRWYGFQNESVEVQKQQSHCSGSQSPAEWSITLTGDSAGLAGLSVNSG